MRKPNLHNIPQCKMSRNPQNIISKKTVHLNLTGLPHLSSN